MRKIEFPFSKRDFENLDAGNEVLLSGVVYTARDQAHKKLAELIGKKKPLPLVIKNQVIYYCGPTPASPGQVIGSCGPTTSRRMDCFTEPLLEKGLGAMIGKGGRAKFVRNLIKRYHAVYFIAPAGCGALLAGKVLSKERVYFEQLGPEAVYKLAVKDFPLIVAIDARGRSIYGDI